MTDIDTRPDTTDFTITREAMDTMRAASDHCVALSNHYGADSKQHTEAVESWQRSITQVFCSPMGQSVRVTRDGALSLYVVAKFVAEGGSESMYDFGLIWFGDKRKCTREGCKAYINDDGTIWTFGTDDHRCEQHIASYGRNDPQPGTWSIHS